MSRLTPRSIKKIALPTAERGPEDHPDSWVTGLCLTVRPSGVMTWTLRYRAGAIGKRFTIGKHPILTLATARKRAQALLLQIADGIDPNAEKQATRNGEIKDGFPDLAVRFIEQYALPKKNRSWLSQARVLGLRLGPQARRNPELERHWGIIPGSPADRWSKRAVSSINRRDVAELIGGTVSSHGPAAAIKMRDVEPSVRMARREWCSRNFASRRHQTACTGCEPRSSAGCWGTEFDLTRGRCAGLAVPTVHSATDFTRPTAR